MTRKRYLMIVRFIALVSDSNLDDESYSIRKCIKDVIEIGKRYDIKPNEVLRVMEMPLIVMFNPNAQKGWGITS